MPGHGNQKVIEDDGTVKAVDLPVLKNTFQTANAMALGAIAG
jgi:hypothetical protein